jgi:hypothetical protein
MHRVAPLSVMQFGVLSVSPDRSPEPRLLVPRAEALDLLDWLGLGRPEFGAIDARELAPRCRRRLWPLPRNLDPAKAGRPRGTLRQRTAQLLAVAEEAGELPVTFG